VGRCGGLDGVCFDLDIVDSMYDVLEMLDGVWVL
jgi:hypothetical protein